MQEVTIKWLESVDSTQEEVRRHLSDLANLSVVAARDQTAGRGQRGNKWNTRPGENLTFSILLRPGQDGIPAIPVADSFRISEVSALAVRDVLEDFGIPTQIKWPNDIYAGDRKICGMLIENILRGGSVSESIIGIGLNVNQTAFDPELPTPVSMARLTGRTFATEAVLQALLGHFCLLLETDPAGVRQRFLDALYRKEQWHAYTDCATGEVFEGMIKGISKRGLLRVGMPDGRIREFGFKEISYII